MSRPTLWLLEDQLSLKPRAIASRPRILLIESRKHYRTWPFHKRRIAFLVSAMRHFAVELRDRGFDVDHHPLKPDGYRDSLSALRDHIRAYTPSEIVVIDPSEHHTRSWIESIAPTLGVPLRFEPNDLFLTDRAEFAAWAGPLKSPVMETFYRKMRKRFGILMQDGEPVGGKWNLDKENRKPPAKGLHIPKPIGFKPDAITLDVLRDVEREFADHPGSLDRFDLAVTRLDAMRAFDDFLDHRLPLFGDYEDAMITGEPLMYHSGVSHLLNAGLLDPTEMVRSVEARFRTNKAPLNSVEGFVRQIIGWREYVYGIYHTFMPDYRSRNAWNATTPLPAFFWTASTDMNCLRQCIGGVVEQGFSHHIQRLMVICNFATLAGLSPQAVNDWFHAMYIDSHDWVVTPNVIGMGMNADGGTMATKPYVSSAAYINRMSDYCKGCRYDPSKRTGNGACPFNHLYWTFMARHRKPLSKNMRMAMMLKNLDRIDPAELQQMRTQSDRFVQLLVRR
jgi:deoxyribodipyrimidine photolyase-related protein